MKFITADFETYYDRQYSLSKITTEEYIRSPLFEVIGVSVSVDEEPPVWFSGSMEDTAKWLSQFDWSNGMLLAHNTMFDAAILSWRFGIRPKALADTLSMARAMHGVDAGGSLKALAMRYEIGMKGEEVVLLMDLYIFVVSLLFSVLQRLVFYLNNLRGRQLLIVIRQLLKLVFLN